MHLYMKRYQNYFYLIFLKKIYFYVSKRKPFSQSLRSECVKPHTMDHISPSSQQKMNSFESSVVCGLWSKPTQVIQRGAIFHALPPPSQLRQNIASYILQSFFFKIWRCCSPLQGFCFAMCV